MKTEEIGAMLEQLEAGMPGLMADEKRATEARLRQEGAIMALQQMLRQVRQAEAMRPAPPPAHTHEHGEED